jgi:hypothetical protein
MLRKFWDKPTCKKEAAASPLHLQCIDCISRLIFCDRLCKIGGPGSPFNSTLVLASRANMMKINPQNISVSPSRHADTKTLKIQSPCQASQGRVWLLQLLQNCCNYVRTHWFIQNAWRRADWFINIRKIPHKTVAMLNHLCLWLQSNKTIAGSTR